jgi:hypothetical protein
MNFQQETSREELQARPSNAVEGFVNSAKTGLGNVFNGFSQQAQAGVGASSQFLSSNTIVAKFAFLILVVILFVVGLYLGMMLVGYFTSPSYNPYLVKGMIDGGSGVVIPQDPAQSKAVPLLRSNNENSGMEYTWSVWIYVNDLTNDKANYRHVFNKGDANIISNSDKSPTANGLSQFTNGPGLYISKNENDVTNPLNLHVIMNDNGPISGPDSTNIDSTNVPIRHWVHVAIRLQNKALDVYVNGTIAGRLNLSYVPKQNYYNVNVCQNGGFSGKLADLRYFKSALNSFDINNIIMWGPNTSTSDLTGDQAALSHGFNYLSSYWYATKV